MTFLTRHSAMNGAELTGQNTDTRCGIALLDLNPEGTLEKQGPSESLSDLVQHPFFIVEPDNS